MRLLAFNHHTPFWWMFCRALPGVRVDFLPTPHSPEGWNESQRPKPENVRVASEGLASARPGVVIAQTADDFASFIAHDHTGPLLYLSHNHYDLEAPSPLLARHLSEAGVPLVCISNRKARSWQAAGYSRPVTVIRPYAPVDDMPIWQGDKMYCLTVCTGLSSRPLFDYDLWKRVVRALPEWCGVRLVGDHNHGLPWSLGPAISWRELQGEYVHCGAYLSPTTEPYEDKWNLAALEAMACGCPVVSLHDATPEDGEHDVPGIALSVAYYVAGEYPQEPEETRAAVRAAFPKEPFVEKWTRVLEGVAGHGAQ